MENTKIASVILAGGGAKRMGYPKPLLRWRGKPILVHLIEASREAELCPILVISGAYHQDIQQVMSGFPVNLIYNPNWEEGQSTSVRAAIAALPVETEAAIFLLADQPFVPAKLLTLLSDTFKRTHATVIAPYVGEQRGNPLLFSREVFADLAQLIGDQGGRALLSKYQLTQVPWDDAGILFDIDTPEDYQRLLEME